MELLNKANGIKVRGIVGVVLFFTIFGIVVSLILSFIDAIIILSTD